MAADDHTIQDLIRFARGEIDAASPKGEAIATLIEDDAEARDIVRIAQLATNGIAVNEGETPSADLIASAKAIFTEDRLPGAVGRWLSNIDRVIAALLFDSRAQPATAGLRSAAAASRIQLTYEADDLDIEVQLEKLAPTRWRVMGQIDSDAMPSPRSVAITEAGSTKEILQAIDTDEHGMFSTEVDAAKIDIHIQQGNSAITLPGIDLINA